MKIRVLGAAAGGGYPQWNCNHPNSRKARSLDNAKPRTQSSIAVSSDDKHWVLFNASPDLRQQINDNDILQPKPDDPLRFSPIQAVVLTNADVDHVAGLLNLRESQAFNLYGTQRVLDVLKANSIFNVLNPQFVERKPMVLNEPLHLQHHNGDSLGITIIPFAVPGKVALWLEDESKGKNFGSVEEDTIALEVQDSNGQTAFFYMPACAAMPGELAERIKNAPLIFFDGTLWRDDEMIVEKVGIKTGQRMGHMSLSGDNGTLAALKDLNIKRKVFIHINTTNPVLLENSDERLTATEAGWEVSWDGMEIVV